METLIDTQEKQAQPLQKPSTNAGFVVSLVLFVIILTGSVGLKLFVLSQESQIEETNKKIEIAEQTIATVKSNPLVVAFSLYENAKKSIDMEVQRSEAHRYLARLYKMANDSFRKLAFVGFNYSDGVVTTSASAFGNGRDASENVIGFIKNYREETLKDQDDTYLLDPVLSITGDSIKRDFSISFKVKQSRVTVTKNQK